MKPSKRTKRSRYHERKKDKGYTCEDFKREYTLAVEYNDTEWLNHYTIKQWIKYCNKCKD